MSSSYAQGLELSTQIRKQVSDMEPNVIKQRATVQTWYALSQTLSSLRTALMATAKAADEAVHASKVQRDKYRGYADVVALSHELRDEAVNSCLYHFRRVTELSQYAETVRQHHESALLRWRYRREQFEGSLGPHPNLLRFSQSYYEGLSHDLEAMTRDQKLEAVYVRWVRLRAAADLKYQAEVFHATCKNLRVQRRITGKERKRAVELRKEANRRAKDYMHLEMEVKKAQLAIHFMGDNPDSEG